jgi:hypothetical protein
LRKIATILLLGILLFNWIGYRLYSSYVENETSRQFEAQLDINKYNEQELISVKIPETHLSEYTNSKSFQRVDGQVEIKGIVYSFVKQRLYNDTLEFLCVPNHSLTNIQKANNDYFKLVNDLQHSGQNKKADSHSNSSKSFSADYYSDHELFSINELLTVRLKTAVHFSELISPRQ